MKPTASDLIPAPYLVERNAIQLAGEDAVIAEALQIITRRTANASDLLTTPEAMRKFLTLRAASEPDQYVDRFGVLFLDSQHRFIAFENMFTGTLSQTSVYPREVVRAALRHNAASLVFTHNHPSGSIKPSRADELLTQNLKTALSTVDVRVLDHIITSGAEALSMAEMGLI